MPVNIRPPRRSARRSEPKLRDVDERESRRGPRACRGPGERVARLGRVRRARSARRTRRDAGRGRLRAPRRRACRRLRRAPARLLRVRATRSLRRDRHRLGAPGRDRRHLGAGRAPRVDGGGGRLFGRDRRASARATGSNSGPSAGTRPRPSSSTRNGATGGAGVDAAHGECGSIGERGAGSDHDGLAVGPQRVRVGARLGRGDPLRRPVGGRDLAVEARAQLGDDVRTAGAPVEQVRREQRGRGGGARDRLRRRHRRRAAGECRRPRRARRGPRSRRRPGARPASMSASAHGPVRPTCAQGSRVTTRSHRRRPVPAARSASTSACAPPGGCVAPSPTTTPSTTRTQPTHGFGARGAATSARCRAAGLGPSLRRRAPLVLAFGDLGNAGDETTTTPTRRSRATAVVLVALSHPDSDRRPRTRTWSAHDWRPCVRGLPRLGTVGRIVARGHRRSGLSPNPEGLCSRL